MQIGLKRELEKANEALDQIKRDADKVKNLIIDLLQEQEPKLEPEKEIKETGHKNVEMEQKNVRL